MDRELRSKLIRLAHARPELRAELLPLLTKQAHGAVALKNPQVMLYVIDPVDNKSKFYEMAVVLEGQETSAMRTKDFSATVRKPLPRGDTYYGKAVLMKRWGRLTDRGGASGRVDSMNEIYYSLEDATAAMMAWKREKMQRSGYKDVSNTKTYPIGLGSAGFGWGGQVACQYIPELRKMWTVVNKSKDELSGMTDTLNALRQRESGMAQEIGDLFSSATSAMTKLNLYLEGQLKTCR